MKKVILDEMRWSNVLSYGNNINVFKFQDGLGWLKGPNGSGKSTVIEALTYVLFAKTYRDINLDSLINTTNNKKLIVELDFIVVNGDRKTHYRLRRGLNPKIFELDQREDGDENFTSVAKSSLLQSTLEGTILGFDLVLFKNVISLNTLETKPFLDMKIEEKRKLIESIITLDITKLKKKVSQELTQANLKLTTNSSDIRLYTNKIEELNSLLLTLEQEKTRGIDDLSRELASIESSIVENTEKLSSTRAESERLNTLYTQVNNRVEDLKKKNTKVSIIEQVILIMEDLNGLKSEFSEITKDRGEEVKKLEKLRKSHDELKSNVTSKRQEFSNLDSPEKKIIEYSTASNVYKSKMDDILAIVSDLKIGIPCPTCSKPSTEEDREAIKASYRLKYSEYSTQYKGYQTELIKANEANVSYQEKKKELEDMNANFLRNDQEFSTLSKSVDSFTNRLLILSDKIEVKNSKIKEILPDFNPDKDDQSLLHKKVQELKLDLTDYEVISSEFSKLRETISRTSFEISGLEVTIKTLEENARLVGVKINQRRMEDESDSIGKTKKQIESSTEECGKSRNELTKSSDDIEILTCMSKMLSDEGIKKTVIGAFIPVLNKSIEKNLKEFDLPFSIEFDDSLGYNFYNGQGSAKEYDGLSQGQKRKLHFSISMAFRDFVSMIGNFKINILFLDEVLDISVDDIGLEIMLEILKKKAFDIGGIYLMTHRGESFANDIDNILEVTHDGTFSTITKIK